MAYATPRPNGSWELRISQTTSSGPRSRTLVSFRELSPELAAKAASRSHGAITTAQAMDAARRAGAPVAVSETTSAAARLASALARGERISAPLARVLRAGLQDAGAATSAERAAAQWVGTSLDQRGRALVELLDLADATGRVRTPGALAFPPLGAGAG
ncbi:MAG: hypothetical protein ACR2NA_05270 [Solirubrobacterales bacterium]